MGRNAEQFMEQICYWWTNLADGEERNKYMKGIIEQWDRLGAQTQIQTKQKTRIKIKTISNVQQTAVSKLPVPFRQTARSSCVDLYSAENKTLNPGDVQAISTGFQIEIPEGFEAQIRPRSGLALKNKIGVLNSPGTIDSDYRGEVKVILFNFGNKDFEIKYGDRIAQMAICKVEIFELEESNELSKTERSDGGFGHTGT